MSYITSNSYSRGQTRQFVYTYDAAVVDAAIASAVDSSAVTLEAEIDAVAATIPHTEAKRLQADVNGSITWTFTTAFTSNPIITVSAEQDPLVVIPPNMQLTTGTVVSLSTTAVTVQTNQASQWYYLTATDAI